MLDFLRKSCLEGSNEMLLLQGVVELRLKGWSIGKDACTTLGALISAPVCPSVRTLHLESMTFCSTLFGALSQVQELYIKRCFLSDSEEPSHYERSFVKAVFPLRSLHTLCLDVKLWSLSGVELLPDLRHLQIGSLYCHPDLGCLQECSKLESVTFLAGHLSFFDSATLRKLVYLPCSLLPYPNLREKACDLGELYTEDISLPALETFEVDRACISGGFINPQESVAARARLTHFLGAVSPHVGLDIKELTIQGRNAVSSVPEILCMLEAMAGRFEVQQLDCTIRLSDSGLQQLVSLLPSGMQRVRLPLGSLSAACLASVVLGWHKLEVLELIGAYEDTGLVWSLCEAVQRCPGRQRPLRVQLSSNFVDLCHDHAQCKQRWMARWQQAALQFACGGRVKVQLYID